MLEHLQSACQTSGDPLLKVISPRLGSTGAARRCRPRGAAKLGNERRRSGYVFTRSEVADKGRPKEVIGPGLHGRGPETFAMKRQ